MAEEWLKNLKAGDEVVISQYLSDDEIWPVAKVTPTQIVIHTDYRERRFRMDDGREKGECDSWRGRAWLRQVSSKIRQEIERRGILRFIEDNGRLLASAPIEILRRLKEEMMRNDRP